MPKSGSNPYIEAVKTLLAVLALHEPDLKNNSERIAKMAQAFAKKLKLDKAETDAAYLGGLLHDIGMIHVPAEVLQRNAALTEEEMKLVKQHPALSSRVLSNLKFLRGVLPVVSHHHEAYNGTGYPDGLQGDKIPQGARLLALVESYDAIVSGRFYRDPKSIDEALKEINDLAGKQFDGRMIKDFTEFVKLYAATEAAAER
ncbi:MAG: HD domain-containing protein, partial [Deltaproteobacteria bacterium]|nr:HD domain-containing protein [Deltaproteobacteria bacterium]